ncbi:ribose 1,5-bisphosphokinase [Vibrio salinus]|uniref:ribose 1,5-bisphosphokinase n=1 Tax=Vibrio salinus TaxID=2899784 RepID=UPI001E527DE6|nr:ribose 1,5-bisphosphokinase [Vibrio salinus]MCE0495289.1 ribose 1,5-bisphosphokinase [Vibrio salinus]
MSSYDDHSQKKTGRIYFIVGPSGSGKDSLISAFRERFSGELVVAHRYITRPYDAGGENHITLSDKEFSVRDSHNLFAMSWQANGLNYGIGQEVIHWMNNGLCVLVNGSRAYMSIARSRFGERLIPVVVQVSSEILESRLVARGREDRNAIANRLKRAEEYRLGEDMAQYCIDNSGTIEESVEQFIRLRQSQEQRRHI